MRKKFLASLAGTLAVAGLALTLTTSSVAAPGATAIHLGDVLPGALTDWGGVPGWVQANNAAITAQGYDPVAAADPTGGDCLTVTPASGAIAVGPSCPAGMNVGYAVGDATGNFTMTFDKVQLTFPQGAVLFTDAEALSLVPELTMTVNNDGVGPQPAEPRQYKVNIQTGTITPLSPAGAAGSDEAKMDDIVVGNAAAIVGNIKTTTAPTLISGLTDGLVQGFSGERLRFSATVGDPSFTVSFAYPFDGQLTNGVTARLAIAKVLTGTMFDPFAPPSSSINTPVPLSDLTLSDVLPAGTAGKSLTDTVKIGQQVKDKTASNLTSQLDDTKTGNGIWANALGDLQNGINRGLGAINYTAPLADVNPDFANTIEFDAIPSSAASVADDNGATDGVLITALKALTPTKTSEWLDMLRVSGLVKFAYESPKIQHLTATGITVVPPTSDSASSEPASSDAATSQASTTPPPTSSEAPTTTEPTTTAPSSSEAPTSQSSSSSAPSTSAPPSSSEAPTTSAPSSTKASSSQPPTSTQSSPTVPSSASSASSSATTHTTPSASQTVPSSTGPSPSSTAPTASASSSTKPSSSTPPTTPTIPSTPSSSASKSSTPSSSASKSSTPSSSAPKSSTPAPTSTASNTPTAPASSSASPTVTVTPNEVRLVTISGQDPQPVMLTIVGEGFLPGERVTGVMHSDPVALPDQTADAQGRVSLTWPLPADTPAGEHSIVLTGETTGPLPAGTFTVVRSESAAPATPNPTASSAASGKGLAGTGPSATTNLLGLLGLVATALGGAALVFAGRPSYRRASR